MVGQLEDSKLFVSLCRDSRGHYPFVAVVTLPSRSTSPTVAGCRLVGCSVVSGRALRSGAVAGVSLHVCVGLGPVLASHAPSPPAAAAAAWQGRGRVPIAGWSCGGVGPEGGLRGGGVLGPLNSIVWYVPS